MGHEMPNEQQDKHAGGQADPNSGKPENKPVTVIVNGRPKQVPKDTITFAEVVVLAFPNEPPNPDVQFSVRYSKGESGKTGILTEGQSVKAKEGMEFDVTRTNRS